MACGTIEILAGGLLADARIVNPTVTGGAFQAPVIDSPSFTGVMTVAQETLEALATAMEPLLHPPLDPVEVAKVFRDCANNLPLVPDTQIATKADLGNVADAIKTKVDAATAPAVIAGVLRDTTNGNPLAPDTKVVTHADAVVIVDVLRGELAAKTTDAAVAGVFKNKDGDPLSPGTTLASLSQIEDLIKLQICEGCGGNSGGEIQSFTWDAVSRTLTITQLIDDAPVITTVVLSDLPKFEFSAATPADNSATALPLKMFGNRDALLGKPAAWLSVNFGGLPGVVPWFAV